MKVLLVAIVIDMAAMGGKCWGYNREEYELLCDVLAVAVRRWGTNGEKVSGTLKKALHQTIFGTSRNGGEDPNTLDLQSEYYDHHDHSHNNRLHWCGACGDKHYPGESAPHDLLCLCTPVPEGPTEGTNDELCGRKTGGLGAAEMERPRIGFGPNAESVKKTWAEIVQRCLRNGVRKGLKNLMEEFNKQVELKKNRLGGEMEDNPTLCGGNALNNTCVNYAGDRPGAESVCARSQTWWQRLYEAIKDEPLEKEIENKQNSEKPEKVETNKPSEKNPEISKVKTLTATTQTTSPESGTLINRNQWPLLIFLFN